MRCLRVVTIVKGEMPDKTNGYEGRKKKALTAAARARGGVDAGASAAGERTASDAGAAWTGCLGPAAAETDSCPDTEVGYSGSEVLGQLALPSQCGDRLILHRSQKRLLRCPRGRRKYRSDIPASSMLI